MVLAALVVSALGAAPTLEAAKPGRAPAHCLPHRGKTLAAADGIRVFVLDPSEGPVYACLLSTGTTRRLGYQVGSQSGKPEVVEDRRSLALRSPAVAVSLINYGLDFAQLSMRSVNLLNGASNRCEIGGNLAPRRTPTVTQALLAPENVSVWIAKPNGGNLAGSRERQVAYCRGGKVTVLDSGEGIELESLRVKGSYVSWENVGMRSRARLP
jgi:hypothetical protein